MAEPYRYSGRFAVRITWHGHSCFEFNDSVDLVVDPHDGRSLGLRRPDAMADIVLVSHDHFDHNRTDIVSAPDTTIIDSPGSHRARDIDILGIEACHDRKKGSLRGKVILFRFVMDGIRCLHLGDLCHLLDAPSLKAIGIVDILFIPVGGTFTLDADEAVEVMQALNPTVTIPMHYHVPGLNLSIDPVGPFLSRCGVPVLRVGDAIDFIAEDLPDQREIWLFDH